MSSPIAYSFIRDLPHYRSDAFKAGLRACGFEVCRGVPRDPLPGDVVVSWNRYQDADNLAKRAERIGASVLVAENGYFGQDSKGRRLYAISKNQHHHGGNKPKPHSWNVKPHQSNGSHILICAQRGIGSELMASPYNWHRKIERSLKSMTGRPIKIRLHPGRNAPSTSLADDLKNAHACVIWSSACGIEAMLEGVPVIYNAPRFIGETGAIKFNESLDIENLPQMPVKNALDYVSGNQYSVEQIATGQPFKELLS